jgi:hypothetical protein
MRVSFGREKKMKMIKKKTIFYSSGALLDSEVLYSNSLKKMDFGGELRLP